ncbi:MAG: hypothetical protein LRY27_03445 [Chitinophagales bacterium]|nr:hypothetical protein [Chitinophagales bacterium]
MQNTDLMICNTKEAMCMAGVFGGLDSGVSNNTKRIFLESAYFNSEYIRKTSLAHNLRTDAAQRYEKGADPNITLPALYRAVQLMQELCGAEIDSQVYDVYPTKIKNALIDLNLQKLNDLAGIDYDKKTVEQILHDLDFKIIDNKKDSLTVEAPLYRADVTRFADVAEEIMRIYGLNNIPFTNEVKSTITFTQGIDTHH